MQFSHWKYKIQWILVYPYSWVNIITVNFRIFSSPPKSSILFRSHISSLPSSSTLDTTIPFILKKKRFIYFWLCCIFVAMCRLSLAVVTGDYSLVVMRGLLIVVASLVVERGLWVCRLQQLWHKVLDAPRYVESSQTWGRIYVPSTGRRVLNHWTTREVLHLHLKNKNTAWWKGWIKVII